MGDPNKANKKQFSQKFYIGVIFIIVSLIVGKITQGMFILYFNDDFVRQLSVITYIISWPFFIAGIWMVGVEYADRYKRWGSFRFYYEKVTGIFKNRSNNRQ
jgi:hypothetical protein